MHLFTRFDFMTMKAGVMNALCVRCQVGPWHQERTRVTILAVIVIIMTITAIERWTLTDVAALIAAVGAATAMEMRRAAAS
jgi:hypothetical protein